MCNLSVGVREEGREETLLESARNLMVKIGGYTADAALELIGATPKERAALIPHLAQGS